MRVCIVGIVGLPARYGGFETLVDNLIDQDGALDSKEISYSVFCSSPEYGSRVKRYKGANLIYVPLLANGVQSVLYDTLSILLGLVKGNRNFLILGVSGCIFLPIYRLLVPNIRIITNIDGIEWRREKWGRLAKSFLRLSECVAVKFSNRVICDNAGITSYVSQTYGIDASTIAYGGDHVLKPVPFVSSGTEEPYAVSICRIEPENNVGLILEACSKTKMAIRFVGNWNASTYGKNLRTTYSDFENITLIDPIYDLDSLYTLRKNATVYIHGHSAGGTNPSLVEAMHFKIPIFAFDCSFNRNTLENHGEYFSGSDELRILLSEPEGIKEMPGIYEVAVRQYTWVAVRKYYEDLFHSTFN